jgi:tRNA-guanine family transglycosylase
VAKLFYEELPDDLKRRVIPVVQGHNQMQVRDCVETYAQFARGTLGFGSFGTSGSSSGINTVTTRSVEVIRALIKLVKRYRFNIHLFGVGTPPLLYLFHQIGVASFDSMAWIKAAGYGNIFLPFMRGYLTTYRVATRKHIYRGRFEELKLLTGHRCAFCDDFSALVSKRMYRALHNLATVMDTVHILQSAQMDEEDILNIIALGSPTYLRYYKGV